MKRALVIILVVVLIAVGGFLLYVTVKPLGAETLAADPNPAGSREEALARWAEVEARDDERIDERCHSWSAVHEEPVETTVVLLLCVFAMVDLSVLVLRRRPDEPPGFTVPRAVPALGAVVSVALVVDRLLDGGWPLVARLVALVGAGLVVHLVVRWRQGTRPSATGSRGGP